MSSLLCVKQPGGTVKVHSPHLLKELSSSDGFQPGSRMRRRQSRRSVSAASSVQSSNIGVDSKSLIGQSLKLQDWLNEKTVRELQERSDLESKSVKSLYNPLLTTEETFVKDLTDYVKESQLLELRKKELLHKKWSDRVYEPLRKEIMHVMDGPDWKILDVRKREMHKQYLEFLNEKGHVFLDTLDPMEYYAQSLNGHRPAPLKALTEALRDPLLSQQRERFKEDRIILLCKTGQLYSDADLAQECANRNRDRNRMRGNFTESELDFVNWSQAPFEPKIVDQEMRSQKKRMFKMTPPYNITPVEVPHPPMVPSPEDKPMQTCV